DPSELAAHARVRVLPAVRVIGDPAQQIAPVWPGVDHIVASATDRVLHAFLVAEMALPRQDQGHPDVGRLDSAHHFEFIVGPALPQDIPHVHAAWSLRRLSPNAPWGRVSIPAAV